MMRRNPHPARIIGVGKRAAVLVCLLVSCLSVAGGQRFPKLPASGHFSVDEVGVLRPEDANEIDRLAQETLKTKGYPIVVAVIRSRKSMGAGHLTIEQYARLLFDHWGIGTPSNNRGILLLVSIDDREARIELGADWAGRINGQTDAVMQAQIVPRFKKKKYSEGLVAGAQGLSMIAEGSPGPARTYLEYDRPDEISIPFWIRYAPTFIYLGFPILIIILRKLGWINNDRGAYDDTQGPPYSRARYYDYMWRSNRNRSYDSYHGSGSDSSSGGGFGGGGFGGGFGGGGGSTGRW